MKKKGFTLIELLAVIIILAVVALITVPIVVGTLDDVQKSKFKQSAKSLLNLVKLERDNKNMIGDNEIAVYNIDSTYGNIFFNDELLEEDFSGEVDGDGMIIVNKDGDMAISYSNGKWCAYKTYYDNDIKITKGDCDILSKLSCEDLGLEVFPNNIWSQYKMLKVNSNSQTCKNVKYKVNNGEIYDLTENLIIEDNNTHIGVYTKSLYGLEEEKEIIIDKIDRTPPESVILSAILKNNLLELNITATDGQSGIAAYSFSFVNGVWMNYQASSNLKLTDLTPGTYTIKAKAFNGTYGSPGATEEFGATESNEVTVVIPRCPTPVVTMTPEFNVYGQAKVVSIDYGNDTNCTGSYSIDDGATWNEGNKFVLYQTGTKLIAKNIEKKTNEVNTITYDIDTIDRIAPTEVGVSYSSSTPRTLTVVANGVDPESNIYGYKFSKDGGQTYSELQTSPIYTFTNLVEESYNIKVKAYNNSWYNTKDLVLDNGERVENEELGSKESEIHVMNPADCPAPTITVNPSGDVWAASKTVTITYDRTNECPVRKYSFGDEDWQELEENTYSVTRTLTENTNVATYHGVTNTRGTNYQLYVDKIDTVVPTASFTIPTGTYYNSYSNWVASLNLGCSAGASGITKFTVKVNGYNRNVSVNANNVTYITTEVDGKEVTTSSASGTDSFYPSSYGSGWMTVQVTCTNGAGVASPAQSTSIYYTLPTNTPTNTPTPTPEPYYNSTNSCCVNYCGSSYGSCYYNCESSPYSYGCGGYYSTPTPYYGGGGSSGSESSGCTYTPGCDVVKLSLVWEKCDPTIGGGVSSHLDSCGCVVIDSITCGSSSGGGGSSSGGGTTRTTRSECQKQRSACIEACAISNGGVYVSSCYSSCGSC